jgi:RNA polymerase sigma factor (sigma-70 family)
MRTKHSILADGRAFSTLYAAEREAVLRFFARRVYDPQLALDLTAETFAQAFVGRKRFRGTDDQVVGWLFTIAHRRLVDYYRRGTAERKALARLGVELPASQADELARVEELADLDDARAAIRDALEQLSADQQQALRMRIVEERSYEDVALGLGVSEQTARSRVSRALRDLSETVDLDPATQEMT